MLRRFRRSLFCRASSAPALGETPTELDSLYALARFERPDASAIAQTWTLPGVAGSKVIVDSAHVRAGLWSLGGCYPGSTKLSELRALAATLAPKHAPGCGQVSASAFNASMLALFEAGVVELLGAPPRCGQAGARPAAFRYARVAARRGRPIPSLHHRQVALEDEEVRLLGLLDGRKTQPHLALEMQLPEQGPDGVEGLLRRLELAALLAVGD